MNTKKWLDHNVWDGEDRSGAIDDWAMYTPDELQELFMEYNKYVLDLVGRYFDLEVKMWEINSGHCARHGDKETAEASFWNSENFRNFKDRLLKTLRANAQAEPRR